MFLRNITAGTEEEINTATPGGASRPQLSHDRKTLAYVKRVESRSVLAFYDFDSGENRHASLAPACYLPVLIFYTGLGRAYSRSASSLCARSKFGLHQEKNCD